MSDPLLPPRRPGAPVRRRRNPYLALVILAILPTLALWGMYEWSAGAVVASQSAAPPDDTNQLEGANPPPALSTSLLSFRRTAAALSVDLNATQFAKALEPLAEQINETSCLLIKVNGRTVVDKNSAVAAIPASNQKLLVAAVATEVLGEDFVYETRVVGYDPVDGIVNGDVYLVGGGDPVLAGDWYKSARIDVYTEFNTTSLDELADRVVAAGVTQITGAMIGDASRYDDEYFAPGWAEGVATTEAGPYDALMANDSRIQGVKDKVPNPAEGAAKEFVRILGEKGVTVTGGARSGVAPVDRPTIAKISSASLPKIIEEMLTNSDNNTAELLVKEIGYTAKNDGSRIAGLTVMRETIAAWGIDTAGMVLDDGSGLSPLDRVACTQIVPLLERSGLDSPLGAGLAIAGETGTLATLFADTPLKGKLRGKTGTLYNPPTDQDPPAAKALSGIMPADADQITYAMILNGPTIAEQGEYIPIWTEFANAMASYPAVASAATLGPR